MIKDTILGKVMTKKGLQLKDFVINHKCELETEIRRNMRKMPSGGNSRFRKLGQVDQKQTQVEFTNRNKTVNNPDKNWSGDLAVPETIVQAMKNSFLRNDPHFTIKKEDHIIMTRRVMFRLMYAFNRCQWEHGRDKRQAACFWLRIFFLAEKRSGSGYLPRTEQ